MRRARRSVIGYEHPEFHMPTSARLDDGSRPMMFRITRWIAAALIAVFAVSQFDTAPRAQEKRSRLETIKAAGRLRVCIWPGYYSVSFRNPRNGKLSGIDVDLAREFAQELGVELQFVDTRFSTFMDDLDSDRCDLAMFGIGNSPEREKRVDFTAPHFRSGLYAITTSDSDLVKRWSDIDQPGRVIAVQKGTVMETFMAEHLKAAKLLVVAWPTKREDELLAGRADAFITDYPYAQNMRFQHDWAVIIAPDEPVGVNQYSYAVSKNQPEWLARVNEFVDKVKHDGRLVKFAAAHNLSPIIITKP